MKTAQFIILILMAKYFQKLLVDGLDLEGITIIKDSILVTVLERDRAIVFLDKKGKEQNRIKC